jgi:hypothetical protein
MMPLTEVRNFASGMVDNGLDIWSTSLLASCRGKRGVIMSRTRMDNPRITLTNVITTHGGIDGGRSG